MRVEVEDEADLYPGCACVLLELLEIIEGGNKTI